MAAQVDVAIGCTLAPQQLPPLVLLGFAPVNEGSLLILRYGDAPVKMLGSVAHLASC